MKNWALVLLLLAVAFPAGRVNAADQQGSFNVIGGYGLDSCGSYLDARQRSADTPYTTWLGGYLTAVDIEEQKTYSILGGTDVPGVMRWLDNWCRQNPTRMFVNAANALVTFLYDNRQKQGPQ